jgi:hypothetical protein
MHSVFWDPTTTIMSHSPTTYVQGGFKIDSRAKEGIFKFDEQCNKYLLFNCPISSQITTPTHQHIFNGILSGYRISSDTNNSYPIIDLRKLESNISNIKTGESYKTYINSVLFTVTRDPSITYEIGLTTNRQVYTDQYFSEINYQSPLGFKRQLLDLPDDIPDSGGSKKMRH